jgi:hypothetical protein
VPALLATISVAPAHAFSFSQLAGSIGSFFSGGPKISAIDYAGPKSRPTAMYVRTYATTSATNAYGEKQQVNMKKINASWWLWYGVIAPQSKMQVQGSTGTPYSANTNHASDTYDQYTPE